MKEDNVIFVDVDHTLMEKGRVVPNVLDWCWRNKEEGYTLYLWSARGAAYCQKIVERFGLDNVFSATLSKPTIILDDLGSEWDAEVEIVEPTAL
jgi:predicted HAD superfamily phosphohydrolase YqeG